jgi:hypothetical protein
MAFVFRYYPEASLKYVAFERSMRFTFHFYIYYLQSVRRNLRLDENHVKLIR